MKPGLIDNSNRSENFTVPNYAVVQELINNLHTQKVHEAPEEESIQTKEKRKCRCLSAKKLPGLLVA